MVRYQVFHPTFTFYPLVIGPVPSQLHREHTVLQPFRGIGIIIHIVISVLPGAHFSPESSEASEG